MLFSVVVPVYNAEKYLTQCIESIITQSFKEFELILVDDGSTDGSGQICDMFAEAHENIRVIHKKNEGQVKARIDGVNASKGEYILFGDADDWFERTALNSVYLSVLQDEPDIIFFGFQEIREGKIKKCIHRPMKGMYRNEIDELRAIMICDEENVFRGQGIYPAVWCRAVKRELLLVSQERVDTGLKNGEDLVLLVYCMLESKTIAVLDESLYNYRILDESVSHGYNTGIFCDLVLLQSELEKAIAGEKQNYQKQIELIVLKLLWNCVVKVCVSHSRNEAMRILNKDRELELLVGSIEGVRTQNVGYKMQLMLFLMKRKMWGVLSLLVSLKFRGIMHDK